MNPVLWYVSAWIDVPLKISEWLWMSLMLLIVTNGCIAFKNFVFSDETGVRRRPALVVSSDAYHQRRQEAIIAAITSTVDRILIGDHLISDWQGAGLLFPSVATGIIRTIKQDMIAHKLGVMPEVDMQAIDNKLRIALGLAP